jgi:DNA-binding transcriptional LysR family regulator
MLDLNSLQLFIHAADQGSLSKAAAQSNLALAAVSRRMTMLEDYYGVRLLERTGRGVKVTAAGRELLEHGREVLAKIRQIKTDLSDYANGVRGTVALHASPSALSQFFPQDLARFAALCPDVRIDLTEAHSPDVVAAVRDGRAEVGVVVAVLM